MSSKKQTIHTVNALAGSGKTYQAISYAINRANLGEKICILQPTMELIDQSYADAIARCTNGTIITKLHSRVVGYGSVSSAIIEYLKNCASCGEILFITHAAFLTLPYFDRKNEWEIICDEIPQAIETIEKNLANSHHLISEAIEAKSHDPEYFSLRCKGDCAAKSLLKKIASNKNADDVYKVLQDVTSRLLSRNCSIFVRKESWERTVNNKTMKGKHKLSLHCVLQPYMFSGFKKVILMGAMLDQSLLYKLWSHRVEFKPMDEIQNSLRYFKHELKGALVIKYFADVRWSKNFYSKVHNGKVVMNIFTSLICEEFQKESFIFSINNSMSSPFKNLDAERLNGNPHGLNQYQDYDNVAFLSALNPVPSTFSFLETKWISDQELSEAIMHQSCYQAIMRSSLRKPLSEEIRTVIVPTKEVADWLAGYFTNVTVEQLPNVPNLPITKPGRPPKVVAASSTDRSKQCRRSKLIKEVLELNSHPKTYDIQSNCINTEENNSSTQVDQENSNENAIDLIRFPLQKIETYQLPITLQLFPMISSAPNEKLEVEFLDENELVTFLEEQSRQVIVSKNQNNLISPASFGDEINDRGERSRQSSNVRSAWGIWIDIDGGDMTPDDFKCIFPDLKMYLFNTFSGEGRYRVLFPTDMSMTAKAYKDIHQSLLAMVEKAGYVTAKSPDTSNAPIHGWDKTKVNANSLFYLPCQATTGKADSFFLKVDGKALSVLEMLKRPQYVKLNRTRRLSNNAQPALPQPVNSKVASAIENYRKVQADQGLRHKAFFDLALQLSSSGLSEVQLRAYLTEADYDGSRAKKNEIEDAIKSVKKYGQLKASNGCTFSLFSSPVITNKSY